MVPGGSLWIALGPHWLQATRNQARPSWTMMSERPCFTTSHLTIYSNGTLNLEPLVWPSLSLFCFLKIDCHQFFPSVIYYCRLVYSFYFVSSEFRRYTLGYLVLFWQSFEPPSPALDADWVKYLLGRLHDTIIDSLDLGYWRRTLLDESSIAYFYCRHHGDYLVLARLSWANKLCSASYRSARC